MSNNNNNNNKSTYTIMSGSHTATMNNVINAIKTVAGNVITPMSGSSVLYAPYVPLQTTWITSPKKNVANISIRSERNLEKEYIFCLAQRYEFLFNFMKAAEIDVELNGDIPIDEEAFLKATEKFIYNFKPGDQIFIAEITQLFSLYDQKEFEIKFFYNSNDSRSFLFSDKEFVDLLDRQIVRIIY